MKNTKNIFGATILLALSSLAGCGNRNTGKDTYDKKGRLILNLKNVYFDTWKGEDTYTEYVNEKFNVKIQASNYDYSSWDQMVNNAMNTNRLTDTVHFNLKAYNSGQTYNKWATKGLLKPLPEDMSKWPNIKSIIDNTTNIESLKVNGKLYGIPIANDISNPDKDFSNFTYVYRRDRVKAIDEANKNKEGWITLYKEGDTYTFEEFERIVKALKTYPDEDKLERAVIVDEEWGFPSITNFYKDAPHNFTKDSDGKAICNFTSPGYVTGLEKAKDYVDKDYYSKDQFNFTDGQATKEYVARKAAILYDNFSLENYIKLRDLFKKTNKTIDLDDGTALMKVIDPNGKMPLEGIENWFGITLFNHAISDMKQEKILDILEFLLTKDGTRLAIYGKPGYDYTVNENDEVELTEMGWEKNADTGEYVKKTNGAKLLRYMVTLGNDTKEMDPYTKMEDYTILKNWINDMKKARENNILRTFKEPADIEWLYTPTKYDKNESILRDGNVNAKKYAFGKISSIDAYKKLFENDNNWKKILTEINAELSK